MKKGTLMVILLLAGIFIGGAFLLLTGDTRNQTTSMDTLKISSTAFEAGGLIPSKYTCDGENERPDLSFSGVPAETVSLALIMDDPDIPEAVKKRFGSESFVHWILFNMQPGWGSTSAPGALLPMEGMNSAGENGYIGPCPPDREHRYFFKLYALDMMLDLQAGVTKAEIEKAMEGHIVAQAELIGRYDRKR